MNYKIFIILLSLLAITLSYFVLPEELRHIQNDPEVEKMTLSPDQVFKTFSLCKQKVRDEELCYNAYSAAVKLANLTDCTADGIDIRFRFKKLTEHATDKDISNQLVKNCPDQIHYIQSTYR